MGDITELRRAIAHAIDAGDGAARATRQVAFANSDPADPGTVWKRFLPSLIRVVAGPPVTGDQIERARREIEGFETALDELDAHLGPSDRVRRPADWSGRLDHPSTSADVHNEINDALATLGRYRTNLIVGRPLRAKST